MRPFVLFRCVLASLSEGLSVRRSVRRSVRPSVGPSFRRSVRNAFVKIAENGVIQDQDGDVSYVVYTALFLNGAKVNEMEK